MARSAASRYRRPPRGERRAAGGCAQHEGACALARKAVVKPDTARPLLSEAGCGIKRERAVKCGLALGV